MKFIVSSTQLLKQLQVLGGVINSNNTLPILDNFLFELSENELKITASDTHTTMSSVIEIESGVDGTGALPARLLLDILKTFPEQPLTFSLKDDNIVEISSEQGKYDMVYYNADEFPKTIELEDSKATEIPSDIISTAISKTLFAIANDDLRPMMNGVFFQLSPSGLIVVATDAHKLVKYNRTDIISEEESEFVIPKKPLTLLKNVLQNSERPVSVKYNKTNAEFTFDNVVLTCRLIDGKYPNYEAVIPKNVPNVLTLERSSFLNIVRRVSIFSNKTTHQTTLKMAGTELKILAEDLDFNNRASERIACEYIGDDMQIGFNSIFLTEMLNNLDSKEIQIAMSDSNKAGILTPVDAAHECEFITMIVMPVMVS